MAFEVFKNGQLTLGKPLIYKNHEAIPDSLASSKRGRLGLYIHLVNVIEVRGINKIPAT